MKGSFTGFVLFDCTSHVKALFYKQKHAEMASDASISISSFPGFRSHVLIQVMDTVPLSHTYTHTF